MQVPEAFFLDRDGLINVPPLPEKRYVSLPEEFELLPGIAEAIRELNLRDILVAVVTNQQGIALGLYSEEDLARIHARMHELLALQGAEVQAVFHCPHLKTAGCDCRKPAPGLLKQAAEHFGVDPARCWMAGDQPRDLQAGRALRCRTLYIGTGPVSADLADEKLSSTLEFSPWIVQKWSVHSEKRVAK